MMNVELKLEYTKAQNEIFHISTAKRRIIRKGRRVGFTRGAAQFVIESMLSGRFKSVLWGDTIHQNIKNYVERYFMPVLGKLPQKLWEWRSTDKILRINGACCDFRSADNPENWEGFSYDLVVLNEAGIILKNRYLWENAVAPMLLDNPNAVAVIGGTPKGKGLFYELFERAGSSKGWQAFAYTPFDNPFISLDAINEFIAELGGTENVVRQEIYGDFVDRTSNELFDFSAVMEAMRGEGAAVEADGLNVVVWGVDVARHGSDQSVIAVREKGAIRRIVRKDTPDLMAFADFIAHMYSEAVRTGAEPDAIFVEINGMGAGLFDRLAALGLPAIPADVASKALAVKLFNKRSEMYRNFADAVNSGLLLPDDTRLRAELFAIEYEITDEGVFKIAPKEQIKKKLGYSPDSADACALTFFAPVYPKDFFTNSAPKNLPFGAW